MLWLLPWDDDNHAKKYSWTVYALVAINIAVFIATYDRLSGGDVAFFSEYGLPADGWRWHQFLTANFLHGGIEHLIGNMLFLLLFGDNVEDVLGPIGFLLLYFLGGLLGDLVFIHNNTGDLPSIGASGCISAIAGAYCVLFYGRTITIRLMLIVVPIWTFGVSALLVVLFWFGADLWLTLSTSGQMEQGGGVNYVAHGIGFIFGFLVAVIARVHGVMRRYERLEEGGAWFGYWSQSLERRRRFKRR